jgi:hypothetical protein
VAAPGTASAFSFTSGCTGKGSSLSVAQCVKKKSTPSETLAAKTIRFIGSTISRAKACRQSQIANESENCLDLCPQNL